MDIDVAQLAKGLADFLAPFLPYLLAGTKVAAKAAIAKFGEDAWEQAKKAWGKLWPKAKKKEAAREAVEDAAQHPDNENARGAFLWQLVKLLEGDRELAVFTQEIITGDHSIVVGRDMNDSIAVDGDGNLVASHGGRINQTTNIYNAPVSSTEQRKAQKAFRSYLEKLRRHCNSLPLAALGGEESSEEDITLDKIYIDLDTTQPRETPENESQRKTKSGERWPPNREENPPITVMEAAAKTHRLVLLGEAGAGKSTFAKKLLALQAAVLLGETTEPLAGFEPGLIPILIVLRDLAPKLALLNLGSLSAENQKQVLSDTILEKIREDISHYKTSEFMPALQEAIENGNILLVLDGLDEVPQDLRGRVRQAVGALIQIHKIERTIITSRIRSYTGQAVLQNFQAYTIAPFDGEKINRFAHAWYNEQHRLGRVHADQAEKRARDLAGAANTPDLMEMSSNPMMLTSIAIIHQKDIGLPRERVRLYHLIVDVLVSRWQKHKTGEEEFAPSPALMGFLKDDIRLRATLEILAYEAHRSGNKDADLSRSNALTLLEQPEYLGTPALASEFLDYVDQRSGLLVGKGGELERPTSYSFPHRTIQEYLAGCYLIGKRERGREFFKHAAEGDFWSLAALMGAEELFYNRRGTDALLDIAYCLCPDSAPQNEQEERSLLWSGQIACIVGREIIQRDTGNPSGGQAYLKRLIPRTVSLLEGDLPPRERVEAADTLARLGDPRFDAEYWHLPKESMFGFVHIAAGEFTMGTKKKDVEGLAKKYKVPKDWLEAEVDQHTLHLPDYYLARYPVTVAQFKTFVEDSGYDKMDESSLQGIPNHPVRYVTWFDAIAYCKWLNEKLKLVAPHQKGKNETEQIFWNGLQNGKLTVTLPSEAEWEKAARGEDAREFPWQGDFDQNNANCNMAIGNTSAVGCFPQGRSPYGLLDMAGNVWEWTRSIYGKYPYKSGEKRETLEDKESARVVRGGSFDHYDWFARCAYRNWLNPSYWHDDLGFRVVVVPFFQL